MIRPQQRTVLKPLTESQRHLLFLSTPQLWPCWPFLPLVRRTKGIEEQGLLFDVFHTSGLSGFSATVFLCNLFEIPSTQTEFLSLPKEVHDTPLELYEAGWRVD